MNTTNEKLSKWVDEVAALANPDKVYWCNGSQEEFDTVVKLMLNRGDLVELNKKTHPNCYLYRSDPSDVARTEHLTFICSKNKDDAGPNNNWLAIEEGHRKFDALFKGSMKGRTMYVLPYCMGPIDSPYSRVGVEITDSPYVVANMKIMTRMGKDALRRIEKDQSFVKGVHCTGDLSEARRMILHFPEDLTIKSIGSGYGGNALLGKKCHALRIASYQGRYEGWLAEHMLIVGVQNPQGETFYMTAAFPSACGKTNLAMLIPPEEYKGWKVWTVGDDIAWMHLGEDGRLYAINPEAGFFGVAPGTSAKTNPNALNMLNHDTIFTNVGMTEDKQPWWEGLGVGKPTVDWQGRPYQSGNAAHPNSRFTVSAKQCASYTKEAENPRGVPISAMIFGGRRPSVIPLVFEALNWEHGVLVAASVSSETTAAATGQVGVLRRDPMAMKPFCGYNFADYWQHWLSFGKKSNRMPKVFHVNWFRQDASGRFIWPGFGQNMRALEWMIKRIKGEATGAETPIGRMPRREEFNLKGLDFSDADYSALFKFDTKEWQAEIKDLGTYFDSFAERLPAQLKKMQQTILKDLEKM